MQKKPAGATAKPIQAKEKPIRQYKEANLMQWKDLLDAAVVLKKMKPWLQLWDMDLITIQFPDEEEPVSCSILGRNGECLGICVYDGIEAIHDFFLLADSGGVPRVQQLRYQNCMVMYLGDRLELEKEDAGIIKDLGMKFRGKNDWIFFRSLRKGLYPWFLDQTEVVRLTKIYRQLIEALKPLLEQQISVHFDAGETLLRQYDHGKKTWINLVVEHEVQPLAQVVPVLRDELLAARLKEKPRYPGDLEIDVLIVDAAVFDEELKRPLMPLLLAMADVKSGELLAYKLLRPTDNEMGDLFDTVVRFTLDQGRPRTIYVRDERMESALKDLCAKTGIQLKIKPSLPLLDGIIQSFDQAVQ